MSALRCTFQLEDRVDSPTCDRPAVAVYVVGPWQRYPKCARHDSTLVRETAQRDGIERVDLSKPHVTDDAWHGWAEDAA